MGPQDLGSKQEATLFMRKIFAAAVALLLVVPALAQSPQLAPGQVMGNSTGSQRPAQAIYPQALPQVNQQVFSTLTIAAAANIPPNITIVTTLGRTTAGDNGGGNYIRIGGGPAAAWRFQSADGQWWALNNRAITPEQFGCVGNGVTDDTACFNSIGTFLTTSAATPPTLNHRPGATYQIWPNGSAPSTLMTLDTLLGFEWNFNGSCFRTNQVFAAAYGVAVIGHARDWIINDPCYESTAWAAPLSPLLGAIFLAVQETVAPWSQNIVINNGRMTGGVGFLRVTGSFPSAATAIGGEANNIVVNNAYIKNVMYPLNFQSSGDHFVGNNIRVSNVGRAYFPANVSNHRVNIIAEPSTTAGTLQQVDIAVYPYPSMPAHKRGMANIDVTYRLTDPGTFANGEVSAASFIQTVPRATISAAASCGATCTRLTVNSTANMATGQSWYCSGATGTTAINGHQTITVQSGTTVDVPVTFVATSPGGYCTVPGSMRDIKLKYDVINDGVNGTPLIAMYRYDEVPVTDTFDRGYEISNFEISGRLLNYDNTVTSAMRLFSPALGTWTSDSVNNFAIRNFVMTGGAGTSVSISGPASSSTIALENIVSTGGTTWVLGGTASAFNVTNVSASGIADRMAIAESLAPANQFTNGMAGGGLLYAQPAFSNLSGLAQFAQIQDLAALSVFGRSANSIGVGGNITCGAGSNGVLREAGNTLGCGAISLSAISGLATGMSTWLGTPSSANLRGTLTDETGTGLAYFQGGDIGTPSAGVVTNLTGTASININGTVGATSRNTGAFTQLAANAGILNSSSSAGIGYSTGAGCSTTQVTSRTTGVSCAGNSGSITLFNAAGSGTTAAFTVTNASVAQQDTISLSMRGASNVYNAFVSSVVNGGFTVGFYSASGTAIDSPTLNFNVIKGVNN